MTNITRSIVLGIAMFALAANAFAQGATPLPLDKATVSADVAKRTLLKTQISASIARQIVDACVEFARTQQGGPGTYAIFVLAPNGVETGLLKAKTALYARTPSSAVAQRFPTIDGRLIRTDLGRSSGLAYYFVGGGLPIVVQDELIGAIGVGGGNMDEQCAYSALTKVLGPQPPLPPPQAPAAGSTPAGGPPARGR
jgi:Haem-degrading